MRKPSILIVEDEAVIAADLAAQIGRLGYDVAGTAATGLEAVEYAGGRKPSLVLMDVRLAGAVDGIAAAEAIQREFQVPVVFLTAHADVATLQRASRVEAFGYILKPFDERTLRIQIEMALHKHAAERKLRESRQLLEDTQHLARVGGWAYEAASGRLSWTDEMYRLHGVSPETFDPNDAARLAGFYTPGDRDRVDHALRGALDKGLAYDIEVGLTSADGRRLRVRILGRPDLLWGKVTRVVGSTMDITELHEAQEAVERLNRDLAARVASGTEALRIAHEQLGQEAARRRQAEESLRQAVARRDAPAKTTTGAEGGNG